MNKNSNKLQARINCKSQKTPVRESSLVHWVPEALFKFASCGKPPKAWWYVAITDCFPLTTGGFWVLKQKYLLHSIPVSCPAEYV